MCAGASGATSTAGELAGKRVATAAAVASVAPAIRVTATPRARTARTTLSETTAGLPITSARVTRRALEVGADLRGQGGPGRDEQRGAQVPRQRRGSSRGRARGRASGRPVSTTVRAAGAKILPHSTEVAAATGSRDPAARWRTGPRPPPGPA